MFKRVDFRKRILMLYLFFLAVFLSLIFPISNRVIDGIARRSMNSKALAVSVELAKQTGPQQMVKYLIDHEINHFFHMTLLDGGLQFLYDNRLVDEKHPVDPQGQPAVLKSLHAGKAFEPGGPTQPWTFAAVRFYCQDEPYIIMTSLTFDQMHIWMKHFRLGLFALDFCFMFLFCTVLWLSVTKMTRPMRDIANAVKSFSQGKTDSLPLLPVHKGMGLEFKYVASALNHLSEKVRGLIPLLAEEKNEKEAILETLLEGVIVIDATGIVRCANHIAASMLATSRRQMIGKPFIPAGASLENHPKIELFKRCESIVQLAYEQNNVITDSISLGEAQKTHLDLIAVPKPNRKGAIIILQDKSSQYKVVEMGKDFIANASHELRTPITIIKGFAETLQDLSSISRPMLSEITEKIVRNCQRMDTLVKNLLTLADIEYVPETRFQSCDIVALADNCRHLLLALYPTARVDIEKSHPEIMCDTDPNLLELALMNLLENGVKYSNSPAHLTLYLKEQGDETLIAVQDRGIGIPKNDLPHIFERFYTVDKAHSRRLGGAGLGLSIVKTIIEKHEGTISAASVVGQGTTFTILIPQHRHAIQASLR